MEFQTFKSGDARFHTDGNIIHNAAETTFQSDLTPYSIRGTWGPKDWVGADDNLLLAHRESSRTTRAEVDIQEQTAEASSLVQVDVSDVRQLNLFRCEVAKRRKLGQWLLIFDGGDRFIIFPGSAGPFKLTVMFSSEIDVMLSYRWRDPESINGFSVCRNLVEGPDGVRSYKQRTWCDTIAHLGDDELLQDVLARMGELYKSVPVRALDYEDGMKGKVDCVQDVLSRGWIWQEQGISNMSATVFRHPWMSAIAWLYQQSDRSRAARNLPGVVLSTDVHVIAVRERDEGLWAERLFHTLGLKALFKFDKDFTITAWTNYKPRDRPLDVSDMKPGALANCYRSKLSENSDAPYAFMGVMLAAAGKSADDAQHRAKLHSQMIVHVLESGVDWAMNGFDFDGNCNGTLLQPRSHPSDIRRISGFIPPISATSGLTMFILSWCISITVWFFTTVWLSTVLDMSSWDVRAAYLLNYFFWCWIGFMYGNEFIRRVVVFKTLPTSSLIFIVIYWSVACVHGCLHIYATAIGIVSLAKYTLVVTGVLGGSIFVFIMNRQQLGSAKVTPAWLSRCFGANQSNFKMLGEPIFGRWYEVRLATGSVVKVWSAFHLESGADMRCVAVRSDGQLARLQMKCGTVFVRVPEMVEAIEKTLEGDLSLFAHAADESKMECKQCEPADWWEYIAEQVACCYFRGDSMSNRLFSTRRIPMHQCTDRLQLIVDNTSILGTLTDALADDTERSLSLTTGIRRAVDEGKSTMAIFGTDNVISISRLANLAYVADRVRGCDAIKGDYGVPGLCNVGKGELDPLVRERYFCLLAGLGWCVYAYFSGFGFIAYPATLIVWSIPHIALAMACYSDTCGLQIIYNRVNSWLIGHWKPPTSRHGPITACDSNPNWPKSESRNSMVVANRFQRYFNVFQVMKSKQSCIKIVGFYPEELEAINKYKSSVQLPVPMIVNELGYAPKTIILEGDGQPQDYAKSFVKLLPSLNKCDPECNEQELSFQSVTGHSLEQVFVSTVAHKRGAKRVFLRRKI